MELINYTIGTLLKERARATATKIGLRYREEAYTWQEIDNITNQLCYELDAIGVRHGDYVGLLGSNSVSWVLYYFALMKLGAVAVLFSTRFKEVEIERGICLTKIKCLIYSEGYKNEPYDLLLENFKKKNIAINNYISMKRTEAQWKETAQKGASVNWHIAGDCQAVANVLFTSGTTSNSKGVRLTHYNLVNNARAMVENMHWSEEDLMCVVVPLFHCFGVTACMLTSLCSGAGMVIMSSCRTLEVCKCVQNHRCTILNGVPSMFLAMLKNPERTQYDISSIKSGIIAGSPIFAKEYIDICNMFEGIKLQPSYGQTETSPCITISDYKDSLECKSRTAGKAIEHVEIRICHLNSEKMCGEEEEGEIQVRGYNVMKDYIRNSVETAKAFTKDGWLKTGDMGYVNHQGYVHITGRCKNMIIRGGENISPVEIENCIKEVAKNSDVKVFGVPSVVLQEDIVACLEREENPELRKIVLRHLEQNLSDYKIPKHIYFMKEMPRSSTGKIDEKILKNNILKLMGSKNINC